MARFRPMGLLLAAILSVGTACGGTPVAGQSGVPAAASSPAGASSSGQASSQTPILIGVNMELTGPQAAFGVHTDRAFELGVDEINKAGGIDGRQLKLITYDNAADPTKAATNAQRLIDQDNVLFMVGPSTTNAALAATEPAAAANVGLISFGWGSNVLKDPHVYRVSNNLGWAAQRYIDFVLGCRFKRVAIWAETSALGDNEVSDQTKAITSGLGVAPVAVVRYQAKATDVTAPVLKLIQAKPEVIINNGGGAGDIASPMKAARRLGGLQDVVWVGNYTDPALPTVGGLDVVSGGIGAIFVDYTKKEVLDLAAKVKSKWGDKVDYGYVQGYDAAYIAAAALREPGATSSRASFLNAMDAVKGMKTVGGPPGYTVSFSPGNYDHHDAYQKNAQVLLQLQKDGSLLPIDPTKCGK